MSQSQTGIGRRKFLHTASCGAYVAGLVALAPATAKRVFAQTTDKVVAKEAWGRIEQISDGMWAMISTLESGDFTTVCNGGIIVGDRGVLAIESFMQPRGAKWVAEWAEKLTGRWPTEIVISHFHADHSAGFRGYTKDGRSPRVYLTKKTQQLIRKSNKQAEFPDVARLSEKGFTTIDLGNRQITIKPRAGHTPSDVTVEVSDPNVVWTGDLFFNRMVPNYADALPTRLTEEVLKLSRGKGSVFVPGHGPVASQQDLAVYRELLYLIEAAATKTHTAGTPAEDAAKEFVMPEKFQDWFIFSPQVMPRAFAAWYRELDSR